MPASDAQPPPASSPTSSSHSTAGSRVSKMRKSPLRDSSATISGNRELTATPPGGHTTATRTR